MKHWLAAFRLRTLPLAFSSILLGSFLAAFRDQFNWVILIMALLTTTCLQILSNLANDYGDFKSGVDNEDRTGPDRTLQSGVITQKAMFRMIILFAVLSIALGFSLVFYAIPTEQLVPLLIFLALGIAATAAAIKYTMGKNPYGYRGLGDVFVFLFFGLTGVIGVYYLYTGTFHPDIILPAASVGLFATGVLNLNNMRDILGDTKSGKRTLVVMMGLPLAKRYHTFLLLSGLAAGIVFTLLNLQSAWQWLFLLVIPLLIKNIKTVLTTPVPEKLDPLLKQLAITTLLYSVLFGVGLLV